MHSVATHAYSASEPLSPGRCATKTTKGDSHLQSPASTGHDSDDAVRDADNAFCSWSIHSALQAAYPPVPLVAYSFRHRARLMPPRHFCQDDLLPVLTNACANRSRVPQGGTAAASVKSARVTYSGADDGDSSAALRLLLCDIATLPWAAGSHLTLALKSVAMYADGEVARWGQLGAAGGKADGDELNRVLNATPESASVDDRATEPSHFPSIATAPSSLAHADARNANQGSTNPFSGTVTAAIDHTGKAVWKPFSEYRTPQACLETSALALRLFALVGLGQRVPLVAFAAEKVCAVGVALPSRRGQRCIGRTSTVVGQQCTDLPTWLPPRTAVHEMSVEVYAERTPLVLTRGTNALQRTLGEALHLITVWSADHHCRCAVHCSASRQPPPSPLAGGDLRWCISPQIHLIWNGRCWVEETDVQVAEMEERLLDALARGCDGQVSTATAGAAGSAPSRSPSKCGAGRLAGSQMGWKAHDSSHPRLWLPTLWSPASSHAYISAPLFRDDDSVDAETVAALGRPGWAAPSSSSPCEARKHVREDLLVTDAAVAAPAAAPAALEDDTRTPGTLRCCKWVLRLRKTWLVTSPNVRSSILARADAEARAGASAQPAHGDAEAKPFASRPAADRGASDNPRTLSSSPYAPVPLRYPNYDLLSGSPLDLHEYNAAAVKARHTVRGSRPSSCCSPTPRPPRQSLMPSESAQPPPARETHDGRSPYKGDPFFLAALSQQVGWVRLCPARDPRTLPITASPESASVATSARGPVSWRLPEALRSCYTMPSSIASVPQRWLCSTTAEGQVAASSTVVASSTVGEEHLAASLQPPAASVSVPRQEWRAGFFLHDAPQWWWRQVSEYAHRRRAAKNISDETLAMSVRLTQEHGAERVTSLEEIVQLLSFLLEECDVPSPPVSAPGATADLSPLVELAPKMAALPPRLCILQLASVSPMLRRSRKLIRRDEGGEEEDDCGTGSATEGLPLELQWSLVPETATVTVNTFFSLQDVVDRAGASEEAAAALSTPTSVGRVMLLYLEVKAALEILRRVTRAAASYEDAVNDAEGPSPPPSSSASTTRAWWEQLSAFYEANTFLAKEAAPSSAISTTDVGHEGGGGSEVEVSTADRHGVDAQEAVVSAFCHPAVSDVVRASLRLMLLCSGPSQHRYENVSPPITLGSGETESTKASSGAVAVWSCRDYHALLHTAWFAVTPSASPYLRSEEAEEEWDEQPAPNDREGSAARAKNGSCSLCAMSALTHGTNRASISRSAPAQPMPSKGTHVKHGSPSCEQVAQRSLCVPYGVDACKYDGDGSRCEPPAGPRDCAVSHSSPQPESNTAEDWRGVHLCPLNERSVVDRRIPLAPDDPLTAAIQTHNAPGKFGAESSADLAFASSARVAHHKGKQHGEEVGVDDVTPPPRQLSSARPPIPDGEDSSFSWPLEDRTDSASPAPPANVIDSLIAEEHNRFDLQWKPWLQYLPLVATWGNGRLPTSDSLPGPRVHVPNVFPFVKVSAAAEYCVGCPLKKKISAGDSGAHVSVGASTPPADGMPSDGAVVVHDLGLCVLRIAHTDVFVNAANLLFRDATDPASPSLSHRNSQERSKERAAVFTSANQQAT
ncbi:hypothetical protein LSCM1_06717 [Leishmania martiniquensis]|uniref:Uncharacterized protein n=1 Tax=Leishmania martiniquensis TaxID=1580590 RepID=A0A836KNM7_9TRYP|nr:hypothetical protein LSCM1_06717 [Leishmania martiniquensis]